MAREFEENKLQMGSSQDPLSVQQRNPIRSESQITPDDSIDNSNLNQDDRTTQVLIVDDQNFNIVAIKAQIEALGVAADVAVSGAEALNLVKLRLESIRQGECKMYDLVLLDYCMPGMDGLQTAEAIRDSIYEHSQVCGMDGLLNSKRKDAASQHIVHQRPYICCLTAYTMQSYKESAIQSGMNDFITKPISSLQLEDLLLKIGVLE